MAQRFLTDHVAEARAAKCDRVLISFESLYHNMVVPERLAMLRHLAEAAGLDRLSVLLFFREPVSHAISAYCHRSGELDLGPFDQWLRESYEFPRELPLFLATLDESPDIDWCPRVYSKERLLDEACTWLGVEALPEDVRAEVNVSVSVDEAEILNRLRLSDPGVARSLRLALKAVPRDDKADDSVLRSRYREVAARALEPLNPELDRLSALVGMEMNIQQGRAGEMTNSRHPPQTYDEVTLSVAQIDAILGLCNVPPRPLGRWNLVKAPIRWIRKHIRLDGTAR